MSRLAALALLALLALVGCGSAEAGGARQVDEPAPVADVLEPMPDAGATLPVDAPDASPAPDAAAEAVDAAAPVPDASSPAADASPPPPVDAGAPVVDASPVIDASTPPVDAAPATVNVCVLDTPYLLPDTLPATTLRQLNCGGSPLYLTDLNRVDGTATFRFAFQTATQRDAGPYGGSTHCDVAACEPGDRCVYLGVDHPGTCKAVAR